MYKKIFISFCFSLVLSFILCGFVFAVEEISWSSTNQQITDEQFKNIIFSNMNLSVDVLNENFDSYTSTISNFNYTRDILNTYLNSSSYTKAFMNYDNKLILIFGSNKIQIYYQNFASSSLPKKYYLNNTAFVFDFDNKTIETFNTQQQYPFYDLGWWLDGTDLTQSEFETTAYKQNMIYETFFLVLGPIYDNSNTTQILNYVKSYKIDGNLYENEQFTGEIIFSNDYESWQTRNLSNNFINSEDTFTYYIHGLDYSESGIASDSSFKIKISDINFVNDSIYLPSINQVNNAIKQAEGYMNYAYVVTLTINDVLLLRSDVFIVDGKPIAMIPYFRYKYDYVYYGSYINIGESGDIGGGDSNAITSGEIADIVGGIVNSDTSNINSGDSSVLTNNNFQIEDPTEDIIFGTFQNIANVMTSVDNSPIETTFMGKPIILRPDVWKIPEGPLKALFVAYFSYWVGKSIILDIRKTINKFKEGNFESIATEDISANMV